MCIILLISQNTVKMRTTDRYIALLVLGIFNNDSKKWKSHLHRSHIQTNFGRFLKPLTS